MSSLPITLRNRTLILLLAGCLLLCPLPGAGAAWAGDDEDNSGSGGGGRDDDDRDDDDRDDDDRDDDDEDDREDDDEDEPDDDRDVDGAGDGPDAGGSTPDRNGGGDRRIADITLRYSDGWVERIVAGRYELIDNLSRQVILRTATWEDYARMIELR